MGIYLREKTWWMGFLDQYGRRVRKSTDTDSKTEAMAIYMAQKTKVWEGKFF